MSEYSTSYSLIFKFQLAATQKPPPDSFKDYMATVGLSLESANVVGYASANLQQGSKGAGLTFAGITTATKLGDLTIVGYDASTGYSDAEIFCSKLDPAGGSLTTYFWYDYEDEGVRYRGWFDEEGNEGNDVELALGEGLWIGAPNSTFSTQSAGQVAEGDISVKLRQGSTLCPNPTPVTLPLNSVTITGYDPSEGYSSAEVFCSKLDAAGGSLTTYFWYDFEDEGTVYYGWYDEEGNEADITLSPAESIWVGAPNSTFSVVFPSAM